MAAAIAAFRDRLPAYTVDLVLSDATLDPVGSDIELAIRVGWLADSALRARRIGTFEKVLVAGPGHAIAPDATPADVAALPFVANSNLGDLLGWTRRSAAGLAQTVRFTTTLAISATIGVLQAARGGAGLAIQPDFAVAYDLELIPFSMHRIRQRRSSWRTLRA